MKSESDLVRHRKRKSQELKEREIQINKSTIINIRSDLAQDIHIKRYSCMNKCHISIKSLSLLFINVLRVEYHLSE